MPTDPSEGWDALAERFMQMRSGVGASLVRDWAIAQLPAGSAIVDVGCGSGVPIAETLIEAGFAVSGIDASPRLVAAFHARFPEAPVACEAAQLSAFFGRTFDAAVCVGLIFLLSKVDQAALIGRVAQALKPGGRFLFTAPLQACEWPDTLTGRLSRSLGQTAYAALLDAHGLSLVASHSDEGGNHYYEAIRPRDPEPHTRQSTSHG
ncbi:class I SAM-dependent methyltransferase [Asticcacaulis excentricus]|uniref:Methyltransferase type 11 n=1 Tax=Asticcacaulis excentricus (strain ATCC 15261 / DSM 4724 / KCTC 12464 / NCIMB 9791 / VKM B-1370 / CB 48) TaxID=573065 RepID=E8RSA3_ASTEC|nr:class I SAM-dependent methyltransferase [Asticcacaulis excentricus]ADU14374.1 Methyltransferase type 11 [Asticcacaulis excentricus CB 48]